MGWGNIVTRRLKVFSMALLIYFDYKAVQKRAQWVSNVKKSAIWTKTHERNARRVLNLMIELEGLWVKMGQYLSTRADVLPEPYINVLKQLQDSLPPRPLEEVRGTIEKELGKSMSDLFADFVLDPLATASIAQVHRATLVDGREVVVKIQHDGIKEIILEDLKNAKSLVEWIAWAEPRYDFNPMIDEWCKEAPKELDFNHEAENTRAVSRNLSCKTDDGSGSISSAIDVLIPEVIQSTDKVLILEYMDGIRLNDNDSLEAYGVDKQKLVEEITRAYAHQIYIDGFFNGDPHPGNFLVSKAPPHKPILLDFGLTKRISNTMRQALAKMFLSCAEGDHVALLSAFAEMGLKLRVDMPQQAMDIATIFFRQSTTASEAKENIKALNDQRERNVKALQEKMKMNKKEVQRFNPVDAFPGDAIIFTRVLNLLRGLSASLNVRIVYMDIMRPFAESTLLGSLHGQTPHSQWIFDSPANSDVESKLRNYLLELGSDKILGIQVCAYKDGKVIIDTAAGMLGKYDPRPVQPDSLFSVFSVTKGITAGMVHWLVDKGKLKYEETVANIWPNFGTNGKEPIKVHHILNHTSGLHNALGDIVKNDPLLVCDWEETLNQVAKCKPETEPGSAQIYHYLSYGWLCGGVIEHASGKKFQEVLEEAIVRPLHIEGELYIGIPPGVESRLAALTVDTEELQKLSGIRAGPGVPPELLSNVAQMASGVPVLFNTLNVRRAIIPAANGHCSARALARYYAALARGGSIPPPHSASSKPALGSHVHTPKFPTAPLKKKKGTGKKKCKGSTGNLQDASNTDQNGYSQLRTSDATEDEAEGAGSASRIFSSDKILDAFMGVGEYESMIHPNGKFGLGFRRYNNSSGKLRCFGHSGMGGSTGFCDVDNDFAIVVMVNKMSLGSVTRGIVRFVCEELGLPVPDEFSATGEKGPDMVLNFTPPQELR
ncbi:hypothetical protein HU200_006161 [Digitaria exilis]|uniref:Uncharacterized protein n=1 Tax=Digitaria exilis TaxID=1010633 RepID=A0A835FSV1_9POAL|nr:hypothetical protein HU200_006161 [Digitaria exilis]